MKKVVLFFFALGTMIQGFSQITLEHSYSVPSGKQFYFTDLGNNNYKYFLIDYYSNKFSLYNLDHSPYILNITTGVALDSGAFNISYITSSLFDCDSANIEYAISATNLITKPFYVFRTDGTLLFQKDSVIMPYCMGCFQGTKWIQSAFNTPIGAKLLLVNLNTDDWSIYGLCGTLPESIKEIEQGNQYVKMYPIPTSGIITMEIDVPGNLEDYEFTIYNSSLQNVKTDKIRGRKTITINNDELSSGNYFFSLQSSNKIVQTGKFILSK